MGDDCVRLASVTPQGAEARRAGSVEERQAQRLSRSGERDNRPAGGVSDKSGDKWWDNPGDKRLDKWWDKFFYPANFNALHG